MGEPSGSDEEFNQVTDTSSESIPASSSSSGSQQPSTSRATFADIRMRFWLRQLSKAIPASYRERRRTHARETMSFRRVLDRVTYRRCCCGKSPMVHPVERELERSGMKRGSVKNQMQELISDYFERRAKAARGSTSEIDALERGLSNLVIGQAHGEVSEIIKKLKSLEIDKK